MFNNENKPIHYSLNLVEDEEINRQRQSQFSYGMWRAYKNRTLYDTSWVRSWFALEMIVGCKYAKNTAEPCCWRWFSFVLLARQGSFSCNILTRAIRSINNSVSTTLFGTCLRASPCHCFSIDIYLVFLRDFFELETFPFSHSVKFIKISTQ